MLKAMKAAGIGTRPNEALRHCYGTRAAALMLRDGYGAQDATRIIMGIMGHNSAETSARYVKLASETLRKGVTR